jgi:GNAT superfamily N-acetyltransferase
MRALRTHYADEAEFVRRVDEDQRPQGYRIVGAFDDGRVVAVAGFRVVRNLFAGDMLYVDDLSTLPEARGRGHGGALLDWCVEEGRRLGCGELHLDSAVVPERQDAHRLYFNRRMRIASYHFTRRL